LNSRLPACYFADVRTCNSRPCAQRGFIGDPERAILSVLPMNLSALFHPAIAAWFAGRFASPTPAQVQAWPAIQAGRHTLIAAPTGSGKTLAAFLAAIDGLLRQGLEGRLADATQIVYVSPLKALSNDI
jgi:ATP-dependent helicase Lhr and Lhr-like helicase